MAKRAYSPKDVASINHKVLPFTGKWKEVFGEPEQGDTWFVSGPSASGKSSFVMQLAKMLWCRIVCLSCATYIGGWFSASVSCPFDVVLYTSTAFSSQMV